MINKAINHLVLATVDSLTKFKNKFAYYLAIFAMVFGSTFGALNSANATDTLAVATTEIVDVDGADGDVAGDAEADQITDLVVFTDASGAQTATFSLTDGDFTIASVTSDTAAANTVTIIDANGGGVVTVSGDITTDNGAGNLVIKVDDGSTGSTLSIGGNVTDTGGLADIIINMDAADGVTFTGTSKNVDAKISGIGDGEGTLTVSGSVTFDDTIGATTNLDLITISGTATFGTTTDADAITNTGTATFTGASVADETTTLSGTTTFTSTLVSPTVNITGGTQTFNGKVTASTKFDVSGAASVVNIDLAPDLAELELDAGTVNISVKNVDIANLDINSGDIIIEKTVVNGDSVFVTDGQTTAGVGGGEIYMPVNLSNGQTLILFNDTDTAADGSNTTTASVDAVLVDTALTDYTASTAGDDIVITSTNKTSAATATALSVTANDAKALLQLRDAAISDANADGDAEDAVFNALNAKGGFSATEDTNLAKQAAPQTDMISGSTFATKAMTGSLQGIMSNRMASLRSGDAFVTGMSAGNGMSANSGFIQAFGTEAEQKNKTVGSGTQFGYDASSAGLALGFDGITDNGSVVGLSFSMSNTDVDGKGTGKSKNDIDSYTVSVYADKTTDVGYIEGSLTVGLNENNSSRIVNTAGLDRTYKGDYDSEQVSLKIGGGMPNAVGTGFVTPYGSVTATKISTDAYTETSTTASDALRLRVAQDDVDSIVGTVGLKYHTVLDNGGTPMISLAVNNEFGDNTINSTNTYQGGGTAFTTSTDVEELSATLGLGYSFSSDNTTLELAYEADANDDDYLGHYGSIKIVSKF